MRPVKIFSVLSWFKAQHFTKMTILCCMKSLGTNWYKECYVLLTKAFYHLQPAVWVRILKTFAVLGAESLGLHLSIIFGVTQKLAVSKFYSLEIMNVFHLYFHFILPTTSQAVIFRYKIYIFSEGFFYCSQ